ncbi:HAMP domain-containing protein [Paracoccus caeni]|uniref:histidine kinase n=1 Tax=Paracoccus caeni TaxID=657651 RepID=A0A934W0C2_9RHOB|nr:ATP-binding protein [Paracoccus caeni]MBK4216780.1 HAMP domain-containing protein [Paracoccus caeni]
MSQTARLSIRARLLLALVALALATLVVGATGWISLRQASSRLDELHNETLAAVDQALAFSRHASDLATRAPYLLSLESPFLIAQEAEISRELIATMRAGLGSGDVYMAQTLQEISENIDALVAAITVRATLTDQVLRRNSQIGVLERRFSSFTDGVYAALPEVRDWLILQNMARSLQRAGEANNLVSVGEFQREFTTLGAQLESRPGSVARNDLAHLRELAAGPEGLFELRRLELGRQIAAHAALENIRRRVEAVSLYAAKVTADAQAKIAAERDYTLSSIAFSKGMIVVVGFISAVVALLAALFVSGYVTGNLRAISDAMIRLAVGDRSSRLPRGAHTGDEIGKLFHAFRSFRANALRLDRSNRQLARNNALFQNLYDAMSDGLAIISEDGALIARNSRLHHALRIDPALLNGRPDMAAILADAGWNRVEGPNGFAELNHADGRVVELRQSRLATGGSVMLLSDASERRELEERLRQAQRTEALGKIAGEVAHDFGNILSTISTSLHLIETAPPDRAAALRQSLGTALELGTSLTQRLLAFARRLHLEPEVMDLNELVAGIEDLIVLALDRDITLTIQPHDRPLMVRVDPGQMESALLNLCLNAAQAIEGVGNIHIRLDRGADNMALIEVSDSGRGMSPDVLARAMEPFYTARPDGTGTGLGLAMVYGFIRQSGGDVEIQSSPGRGTIVSLKLDLCVPDATAPRSLGRVLLVEDDASDARHARRVIGKAEITEVRQAADALQLIAASSAFDLVVTDLYLGTDPAGWRIAEAALSRDPQTRVVVTSGRLPASDPVTGRYPGRVFCLPKPIDAVAFAAGLQRRNDE